MSTACVGTVLDAIRAALILRTGLEGVKVFSGPVSEKDAGLECIAFGNGRLNEEAMAMQGNRWEIWSIGGEVRIVKSWVGDIEPTIKATRDRALAILAEIETHVNDTYTGGLPDVELTSGEIEQSFNPEGRVCSIGFELAIKTAINP